MQLLSAFAVQILGAEKALFRALKTKSDTPKYGLIYHASLVGQAGTKNKGKISRVLAARTSLSARVDALGDKDNTEIGLESRAKVEARLSQVRAGLLAVRAMPCLFSLNMLWGFVGKCCPLRSRDPQPVCRSRHACNGANSHGWHVLCWLWGG
jgi:hypothetical protein